MDGYAAWRVMIMMATAAIIISCVAAHTFDISLSDFPEANEHLNCSFIRHMAYNNLSNTLYISNGRGIAALLLSGPTTWSEVYDDNTMRSPNGLALSMDRSFLFAMDSGSRCIYGYDLLITPPTRYRFAGQCDGNSSSNADNGDALTVAGFAEPRHAASASPLSQTSIVVTDGGENSCIRLVDVAVLSTRLPSPSNGVTTYAGDCTKQTHMSIDNANRLLADFDDPYAIASRPISQTEFVAWVTDRAAGSIRKISSNGGVSTVLLSLSSPMGVAIVPAEEMGLSPLGEGHDYLLVAEFAAGAISSVNTETVMSSEVGAVDSPRELGLVGPRGYVFVSTRTATGSCVKRGCCMRSDQTETISAGTASSSGGSPSISMSDSGSATDAASESAALSASVSVSETRSSTKTRIVPVPTNKTDNQCDATTIAFDGDDADEDGASDTASIRDPTGAVLRATDGAIFVADATTGTIRKISTQSTVSTVARHASLVGVQGIILDSLNPDVLLCASTKTNTIRSVTISTGAVSLYCGIDSSPGNLDGPCTGDTGATFDAPVALAYWRPRMLLVADKQNHMIRLIDQSGPNVSQFAGSGVPGLRNGWIWTCRLFLPCAIAFDITRDVGYIGQDEDGSDPMNWVVIRKIDFSYGLPLVYTVAGFGNRGIEDGISTSTSLLFSPRAFLISPFDGNLYFTDAAKIRKMTFLDFYVSTVCDTSAMYNAELPAMILETPSRRHVLISDVKQRAVRRVWDLFSPSDIFVAGNMSTFAGSSDKENASSSAPTLLTVQISSGNVTTDIYFCNSSRSLYLARGDNSVQVVLPTFNSHVINLENYTPRCFACLPNGTVYVTTKQDAVLELPSLMPVSGLSPPSGVVSPFGIAYHHSEQCLYVSEWVNRRVKRFTLNSSEVSVLIGVDEPSNINDGDFESARLRRPSAMTLDELRSILYVLDGTPNLQLCIRRVDLKQRYVSTFGSGWQTGLSDGPAWDARFSHMTGIAIMPDGMLLVKDTCFLRSVSPNGDVRTLTGTFFTNCGDMDDVRERALMQRGGGITTTSSLIGNGDVIAVDPQNWKLRKIDNAQVRHAFVELYAVGRESMTFCLGVESSRRLFVVQSASTIFEIDPSDLQWITKISTLTDVRQLLFNEVSSVLFITDGSAHVVRELTLSTSALRVFIGSGAQGYQLGPRMSNQFDIPHAIAWNGTLTMNFIVADEAGCTVREYVAASDSTLLTVGSYLDCRSIDGIAATAARVSFVRGIAVAKSSVYLFEADAIRRVLDGYVTTVSGGSGSGGLAVDGIDVAARFAFVSGVADGTTVLAPQHKTDTVLLADNTSVRALVVPSSKELPTRVETIAGSVVSGNANGRAEHALFGHVASVCSLNDTIFILDSVNREVRRIVFRMHPEAGYPVHYPTGTVSTSLIPPTRSKSRSYSVNTLTPTFYIPPFKSVTAPLTPSRTPLSSVSLTFSNDLIQTRTDTMMLTATPALSTTSTLTFSATESLSLEISGSITQLCTDTFTFAATLTATETVSESFTFTKTISASDTHYAFASVVLSPLTVLQDAIRGKEWVANGTRTIVLLPLGRRFAILRSANQSTNYQQMHSCMSLHGKSKSSTGFDRRKNELWIADGFGGTETALFYTFPVDQLYFAPRDEEVTIAFDPACFVPLADVASVSFVMVASELVVSKTVVQLAENAAAIGSAVSAATALSGSSAVQAARIILVLHLLRCQFDMSDDLHWSSHPLDSDLAPNDPSRHYVGAMVFNPALVIAFVALHYSLARVFADRTGITPQDGARACRFPSLSVVVVMYFMQPSVSAAFSVLFFASNAVLRTVAVAVITLWVVAWIAVLASVIRKFGAFYEPNFQEGKRKIHGARKMARIFFCGAGEWRDDTLLQSSNRGFCGRWGAVFAEFRFNRRWFAAVEIVMCFAVAPITALQPTDGQCSSFSLSLVIVYGLYMIAVCSFRPFLAPLQLFFVVLFSIVQFLAALLFYLSTVQSLPERTLKVTSTYITVAAMFSLVLKAAADFLVACAIAPPRIYEYIKKQRRRFAAGQPAAQPKHLAAMPTFGSSANDEQKKNVAQLGSMMIERHPLQVELLSDGKSGGREAASLLEAGGAVSRNRIGVIPGPIADYFDELLETTTATSCLARPPASDLLQSQNPLNQGSGGGSSGGGSSSDTTDSFISAILFAPRRGSSSAEKHYVGSRRRRWRNPPTTRHNANENDDEMAEVL